ncbi:MAG: DUF1043 family protein [Cellvibrionaceae bacterium]
MVSTMGVILIALLSLVAGGIAGGLLWRLFGSHQHRNRDLEDRLRATERELNEYRTEVTEHFVETSRRVNNLTRNYKEVHEYLADSAVKLTSPSVGREMLAAAQIHLPGEEKKTEATATPIGESETEQPADGRSDTAQRPPTH